MLMIPLALFSDCGGNDSCSEFDDRQEINKIQEFYAGLLEKYLKWLHGEEKGKLVFPRVSLIYIYENYIIFYELGDSFL